LTASSRAIARGDFSQRVKLRSRTEIGELASTFNTMSDELEHFVLDLKRAATENRDLFMSSIQMLAGAVDEKDPYTRGHSDRVTRYSMLIAKEMGHPEEFLEIVRVSAQLHDVGKIGIEDRILKKPGALTPEEFEIMKTHTTKGANILRPVAQLKDMIPGIELHHESLDGRGHSLAAAYYRGGRHLRCADHKSSLSASERSGKCTADHPQPFRQAAGPKCCRCPDR